MEYDMDDMDDEQSPPMAIVSGQDVYNWAQSAVGAANPRTFLSRAAAAQIKPQAVQALGKPVASMVRRIAKIAAGLYQQSGMLEAQYLRRPNTLCALATPVIAPGATSTFSVQPGTGNSFYRLLGMIVDDVQATIFGFSSLRVGGQEHVNYTQSSPTPPVANAVPWSIFALKESSLQANLAPWVGQVFDANTPITGTVANMTVAASGDAITVSARLVWLVQTDPCGFRYPQVIQQSQQFFNRIRRFGSNLALGHSNTAGLMQMGSTNVF